MTPADANELSQLQELDRDIERGIAASAGPTASIPLAPVRYRYDDGSKFPGGFGDTQVLLTDYWTLRARSAQLVETNLYARGIIRRFVTNVINTGLHLEAIPEESVLGLEEDSLSDWSELIENRFALWARSSWLCDHLEQSTFGVIQAQAYAEALIAGDVLCVNRQDPRTGLPRLQLIGGAAVQTPWMKEPKLANGNRIVHGVELDKMGRQVAYWVRQRNGEKWEAKRLPAWGEKSGRRLAWLVYATDRRLDEVRGKPLLSLILQSLREIDRYRDSVQRKAVINSMLAMFIKKTEDKPGTRSIAGGAVRRGVASAQEDGGPARSFNVAEHIPGLVLDELQTGEEPHGFAPTGTDEKFGDFEEAIIQGVAWALETPPEILRLAFSNNYSASQAAINEFKMFLNRVRSQWGDEFCTPVYEDWLLSEVLGQRIAAEGLLEAWRDWSQYDVYGAWVASDWAGQIKPAVDLSKLVDGYTAMVEQGFTTRDRATRELTGQKFSKNVKRLRIENEQLAEALNPLAPPAPAPPEQADSGADSADAGDAADNGDEGKEAA